ncbi:lipopolysaccharide biosynthesis protein WzxC [Sulfuriferula multivorans]|uniref:Lipopolysaccharide biosynthesis protein WzxC n=1 Tax=Sulfuriferula multivorans TaxID=1559896 RepID=A0A401JC33_9PROT|nr:oligosaccharide flippase family protein [Sulfuriferula multivorans]GBL45100.1 lipopolysaccharide biosynthesis protein WzxC [Sulfuriferula multivorans]
MSSNPNSLTGRSLRAIKWNYLGTVGRILAQLVSQIILARLLGPEPTGLFGYALLVVSLSALVTEMGLSSALVQTSTLSKEQLGAVVSRLLLVAVVASCAMFFLAEWIATALFHAPEAVPVLRAVAPTFIVSALSISPAALLRRELQFRALTLIGLGSYLFGYVIVGVGVALAGGGVWSLVAAWFAQSISACVALNLVARGSFALENPFFTNGLEGFGTIILFTNLVNWVIEYGTQVLVGRVFGPSSLGLYNVTNNLVRTPANHLVVNLQTVLFPTSARVQDNPASLRRAYLTALSGVALVAFPVFTFAAVSASAIVDALLGAKWVGASQLLPPLALAMIPHSAMAIAGPMLNGKGEPGVELRVQIVTALIFVASLIAVSARPLVDIAWVLTAIYTLRCVWMTAEVCKRFHVTAKDLYLALRGSVLLATVLAVSIMATETVVQIAMPILAAIPHLLVQATVGFGAVAIFLLLFPAAFLDSHLAWLLGRILDTTPALARFPGMTRIARIAIRKCP